MCSLDDHASGINIAMTCGMVRPAWNNNSTALSKLAESLPLGAMMGNSFFRSASNSGDVRMDWRVVIQLTVPLSVLISPLFGILRNRWASSLLGNALEGKRLIPLHKPLVTAGTERSLQ